MLPASPERGGGLGGKPAGPFDFLNALRPPRTKFDPDQPRDEQGRWTSGGGGLNAEPTAVAATVIGKLISQAWHGIGEGAWTLCSYTNGLAEAWPGHVKCPDGYIGKKLPKFLEL